MAKKSHIEHYLPFRIRQITEARELCFAENPEFDEIAAVAEKWGKNRFPLEADIDGIKKFEEMLDLKPKDGDTLEDRRMRVVAKLNSRVPYTEIELRRLLAAICGWGGFELQIVGYELWVWVSMRSFNELDIIYNMLLEFVPEHMWIMLLNAMQFVAGVYAAAQKQKTWMTILPWQERELEDTVHIGVGAAEWQRDPVAILPWQPHALNFGLPRPAIGTLHFDTVTVMPPQVKGAGIETAPLVIAYSKVRQVITVRPGQDKFWRYLNE